MDSPNPPARNHAAPLWIIALALGLIQTWGNRFYMGNDGVSYLDMADAYLRGDWRTAINGSWNPLYAWLVALDFMIFHPSPYWEYVTIQLLNFGIYALTVATFEFFLRGWLMCRPSHQTEVRLIGYGLFVWSSLFQIGIWTTNADMLVAACVYASLGILLRAQAGNISRPRLAVFLGIILAVGYYSKAVMFPFSLMLLMISVVVLRWRHTLIAAAVFAALSMPLIAGLSKATGHLTIGDTSRVNYAWYVNGVPPRWWQGGPPRAGQPQHPPRIMLDSPRVYAYGDTFSDVTYPLWYDFAYWYRGVRIWLDLRHLARDMATNSEWIVKRLVREGGGFLSGLAICLWTCKDKTQIGTRLAVMWPAWGISFAAILLYNLVHIETRYIGAFATIVLLSAYSAIGIERRSISAAIVAFGLVWAIVFAPEPTTGARYWPSFHAQANVPWDVATGLQQMGLNQNERVASVDYSNRNNVFWARLARVHIVAETDWNVDFWRLSDENQRRTLEAMKRSGALIAVSDSAPPYPSRAVGWRRVGGTDYYSFSLSESSKSGQIHSMSLGRTGGPEDMVVLK